MRVDAIMLTSTIGVGLGSLIGHKHGENLANSAELVGADYNNLVTSETLDGAITGGVIGAATAI